MIRMLLAFLAVFGIFYFGITAFRAMKGKQKWRMVKTLTYSLFCAILSLTVLIGIVVAF